MFCWGKVHKSHFENVKSLSTLLSTLMEVLFRTCWEWDHYVDDEIKNIRWWVVAHQIDGFGPDHPPHIHVVTHVDGTANTIAGRPHQLRKESKANKHQIPFKFIIEWYGNIEICLIWPLNLNLGLKLVYTFTNVAHPDRLCSTFRWNSEHECTKEKEKSPIKHLPGCSVYKLGQNI